MDAKEFILKLVRMCNNNLICNRCIAKNYRYLCPKEAMFFEEYANEELEGVAEEFVSIVEGWKEDAA